MNAPSQTAELESTLQTALDSSSIHAATTHATPVSESQTKIPIYPLMGANVLSLSALTGFVAVIGPLSRALHLAEWHAGLSVTLSGVLWMLLSRPWGAASDRLGRRPIILTGIAGFAVSYLALAVFVDKTIASPPAVIVSVVLLMITRGLIGGFYAAVPPTSAALIADYIPPANRSSYLARLGAANGIGMVIGPATGAALSVRGLQVPLYAFAVLPLAAFIVLWMTLPKGHRSDSTVKKPAPKLFDKRLRLPMSAAFLAGCCVMVAQLCVGFFALDRLGLSQEDGAKVAGYTLTGIGASLILAQIVVARLRKISPVLLLRIGSVVAASGFVLASTAHSAFVLIASFCVVASGMGLLYPSFQSMASNSVTLAEQGAAAGTIATAQGFAMVLAPVVATYMYGVLPILPFLAAAAALSTIAVIAFRHKDPVISPVIAEV